MTNYDVYLTSEVVGLNYTERKISAFAKFQSGWRLGAGKSFSKTVVDSARKINRQALNTGFLKTDAFPGRNGDISIVLYDEEDSYEFSITDTSIDFTHEKNNGEDEERPGITLQNSLELISKLKEKKWITSSIYTSVTMTGSLADSAQQPSQSQVMEVVYPSSIKNVLWGPRVVFAPTQSVFTRRSLTDQQCFGSLDLPNYLKDASWSHPKARQVMNAT